MTGTIFITGATAGIGAAAARRFAGAGWKVVATGRRRERLNALVGELGADHVHPIVLDVTDGAAIEDVINGLPAPFNDIGVLLNNAGLALGTGPAQESDLDHWRRMIDTNITGLVTVTRALLPTLIRRKGAILNLSSTAATHAYPGGNVYGGTKAFVSQFSRNLRSDLHGTGVRVTSIEPGMVETEFTVIRTGGDQAASDALYRGSNPMTAEDIAEILFWVATQPPHLNVNRIELMPVSQSVAGFQVAREA
ncbi:MAG TPA: SDR family NAD(P)-dependent oxidoreductase [Allosphingosinicella sp.]